MQHVIKLFHGSAAWQLDYYVRCTFSIDFLSYGVPFSIWYENWILLEYVTSNSNKEERSVSEWFLYFPFIKGIHISRKKRIRSSNVGKSMESIIYNDVQKGTGKDNWKTARNMTKETSKQHYTSRNNEIGNCTEHGTNTTIFFGKKLRYYNL